VTLKGGKEEKAGEGSRGGGQGREWEEGGEMTQTLYAHMNKRNNKKKEKAGPTRIRTV
jgi:hypothetical protein